MYEIDETVPEHGRGTSAGQSFSQETPPTDVYKVYERYMRGEREVYERYTRGVREV